jgi:hypothetical protein
MKKQLKGFIIGVLITLTIMSGVIASSHNIGDILGNIFYTDIVTYFNGAKINSFSLDGQTAIIAEDLKNYGFNVVWNGEDRELYVISGSYHTSDARRDMIWDYSLEGISYLELMDFYKELETLYYTIISNTRNLDRMFNPSIEDNLRVQFKDLASNYTEMIASRLNSSIERRNYLENYLTYQELETIDKILAHMYNSLEYQKAALQTYEEYEKYGVIKSYESTGDNIIKAGEHNAELSKIGSFMQDGYYKNSESMHELIRQILSANGLIE